MTIARRWLVAIALGAVPAAAQAPKQPGAKVATQVSADAGNPPNLTALPSGTRAILAGTGPVAKTRGQLLFEDAAKLARSQAAANKTDNDALASAFQKALTEDPKLGEAAYNLGVIAQRKGNTADAAKYYQDALTRKPSLTQAAVALASLQQAAGKDKDAAALLKKTADTYLEDSASRAQQAELARQAGNYDLALRLAREALFRDPKSIRAHKTMVQAYLAQKQIPLAKLMQLRAVKLDDKDPEIAFYQGQIAAAENDIPGAKAGYRSALELNSGYLPARYALVMLAFKQEDYLGAQENLRKVIEVDPQPELYVNLGIAYKGTGDYDKAILAYDEALKLKPNMPEALYDKGVATALKKEPEKALELFKQYIARRGGEAAVPATHPVRQLIVEQNTAIQKKGEQARYAAEAAKLEAQEATKKGQPPAAGALAPAAAKPGATTTAAPSGATTTPMAQPKPGTPPPTTSSTRGSQPTPGTQQAAPVALPKPPGTK